MSVTDSSLAREYSPFLDELISLHPDWFASLQNEGRLENTSPPDSALLQSGIAESGLDTALRNFRNREMLRIIWRELNQRPPLEETMSDLSVLAEMCLQAANLFHYENLLTRFGTPRNSDGVAQELVVIGLGKLGGHELNLSSDIDVVFAFPETGECDGRGKIANVQFFTRLARQIVSSLSAVNEFGFCFRVDTRLRPFGESGPLVCSFGSMEQYYQREGRDWERYALIKARPVAGNLASGSSLLHVLMPFVYRRYIDFGAVEILREMYQSLLDDSARHDRINDIKRGPGGIREIEFLVQAYQLLRGGRDLELQTTSLLDALAALEKLEILPFKTARSLEENYRFLRRLENTIQALHDQQTHTVPDGEDLERVAMAMRFDDSMALMNALNQTRKSVSGYMDECFPDHGSPQESSATRDLWQSYQSETWQPDEALAQALQGFKSSLSRFSLSNRAAQRLDQFMPGLLIRLDGSGFGLTVLTDILNLVLAICRRSAYLSLLVQNPSALQRMVALFKDSDWVAQKVIRHPALLDELIDPGLGKLLPDEREMNSTAERILDSSMDAEASLGALNYMKLAFSLRIAVAELENTLSARQVQKSLSRLAEVVIQSCCTLSMRHVSLKHGTLPAAAITVIAYGSLGAEEMSYTSDLDLIFLYPISDKRSDGVRPLGPERYYTNVVRRMLSFLSSQTSSGRLYEVDTRLRPNGRSGLLVSSISAFKKYQLNEAWVWELQALSRARACAGNPELAREFTDIRLEILGRRRDPDEVRIEVQKMRSRLRDAGKSGDPFKHADGGLIDIGFVAQMGVLTLGSSQPSLIGASGTFEQLHALQAAGWIDEPAHQTLINALETLTRDRHRYLLCRAVEDYSMPLAGSLDLCNGFLRA
ncbi:MAG: glutamate-ammonia-ligase adenylyltransferase [Lysobacterales bacterium]|jgi:glutamate-ammonia-ligase adenylyltransferase